MVDNLTGDFVFPTFGPVSMREGHDEQVESRASELWTKAFDSLLELYDSYGDLLDQRLNSKLGSHHAKKGANTSASHGCQMRMQWHNDQVLCFPCIGHLTKYLFHLSILTQLLMHFLSIHILLPVHFHSQFYDVMLHMSSSSQLHRSLIARSHSLPVSSTSLSSHSYSCPLTE